ncbi:MAG: ABC transporter ATP-binding protein [Lactobacillus sp.]
MTNNTILQATNVKRYYQDRKQKQLFRAVDGISFKLHAGEIISFVGPNGAGKTTLIKAISNYLIPTSGKIEVVGVDLSKKPRLARQKMGVVFGGDRGFYNDASARDNLAFFARILGVKERDIKQNVQTALEIVNLADVADKVVGAYSKGMLQRLHIARGLVNHPQVLMLDEPTAGLDVESVIAIRNLVKRLASEGRGIILTSHDMTDIETMADRVYLIGNGVIHYEGSIAGVKQFAEVDASASLVDAYLAVAAELKRK